MLKTRIIPTLLFNDLKLVKGKKFNSWRTVGEVVQAARLYNIRKVDELILLDISATNNKYKIDLDLVNEVANECFMPLTFGGGINTLEDISNLFRAGADKVSINTAALKDLSFVKEACNLFGGQSIVISIDYKLINNEIVIFSNSGKVSSNINIFEYLKNLEQLGIGDILLTSIDMDGTMEGYDYKTIIKIAKKTKIPIIASGGAGKFEDILKLLKKTDISGVSASSIYHFTGVTPIDLKKYLFKNNIPVRL
jgi:imidazole glycerol-phosphate synthase subunit HisF